MTDIQEFDFSVQLIRALLWEYNDATNLQSLIASKVTWYDENQSEFWDDWITNVFDLRTANQFGLIVWGILLNLPLYVNNPPTPSKPTIGFVDPSFTNFDNGNFSDTHGGTNILPIATQRLALQLRYAQLTGSATVPEINRLLKRIFGTEGLAYVYDYGTMNQKYIFDFTLTADLIYLFTNFDILPRAAGVNSDFYDATKIYFGFGAIHVNFTNGNFGASL